MVTFQLCIHIRLKAGEVVVQHYMLRVQPVLHLCPLVLHLPMDVHHLLQHLLQSSMLVLHLLLHYLHHLITSGAVQRCCLEFHPLLPALHLVHVTGQLCYLLTQVLQRMVEAIQERLQLHHDHLYYVGNWASSEIWGGEKREGERGEGEGGWGYGPFLVDMLHPIRSKWSQGVASLTTGR